MGGVYEGTDLADKTFIGFKVDPDTGRASVEIINDGSLVVLPETGATPPRGYRTHIWTQDKLNFAISSNGHLRVTIV